MQMMYDIIAHELKCKQLTDVTPEDYLNFYCLGNREDIPEDSLKETSHHIGGDHKVPWLLSPPLSSRTLCACFGLFDIIKL